MWHHVDTKQLYKNLSIEKAKASGSDSMSNNKIITSRNPASKTLIHKLKINGLEGMSSDSEEEEEEEEATLANNYMCWSCGIMFKHKCLFVKHRLFYCKSQMNRKNARKAWQRQYRSSHNNTSTMKRKESTDQLSESSTHSEPAEFTYCYTCSKSFFSIKEYNSHFQLGCSGKIYTCTECSAIFNSSSDLQFHKRRCTLKRSLSQKKLPVPREQNKILKCRCCKSTFYIPELLQVHLNEDLTCRKVHHLKIREEYRRRNRVVNSEATARKSFSNIIRNHNRFDDSFKTNSNSSFSIRDSSMTPPPVSGSARKSFHNVINNQRIEYVCHICEKSFSSPALLKLHKKKHFASREDAILHKCPECKEVFPSSYQLVHHQADFDHYGRASKSISSTCSCPYCHKKFLHIQTRNAHLRYHKDKTLGEIREFVNNTTCDFCFRRFGTQVLKEQHFRIAHSDVPREKTSHFNANVLSKSSEYIGNTTKLQIFDKVPEFVVEQLKRAPTVCPVCHRMYDTTFARNRHFRLHILDGAYECEFCHVKFPRANRLATHMQSVHKDFLKYECKECGVRCSSRLRLLQHVTKMHSELSDTDPIEEYSIPSSMFDEDSLKSSLAEQQHTKEEIAGSSSSKRQFYCGVCKLNFLKLCGLRRHQMSKLHIQLEETQNRAKEKVRNMQYQFPPRAITPPIVDYSKQFTCSVCTQDFNNVCEFVPHRLRHFSPGHNEEMDPYTCEVCGKLMDNFPAIQFHLFWHMQDVQSRKGGNNVDSKTARKSVNSSNSFKSPVAIIPKNLAGQTVAKKTFRSPISKELVIDGIRKPLFTCKECKISLPSKHHYILHMRQYCEARNKNSTNSRGDVDKTAMNRNENTNCSKCSKPFESQQALLIHERNCEERSKNRYCAKCGCLFSSLRLYREHRFMFCNTEFSAFVDDNEVNQNIEALRSTMTVDSNIVCCVQCKVMFGTVAKLAQHMKTHQLLGTDDNLETPDVSLEELDNCNASSPPNKESGSSPRANERALREFSFDDDLMEYSDMELSKITNGNMVTDDGDLFSANNSQESFYPSSEGDNNSIAEETGMSEGTNRELAELRHNFSRLLCTLVADNALMESLGFGERPIDDVLISVLQKMSLTPVDENDDTLTELDKFQCNIRTLLDVCIKDQIMDFIADEETRTHDIVIAALKMFGVESESPTTESVRF